MTLRRADPIRVLAYADSAGYSGAEQVFVETVRGFAGNPDFDVAAATPAENERLRAEMVAAGTSWLRVPVHGLRRTPLGAWHPRRHAKIRHILADFGPGILLTNLPGVDSGIAPLVWARPAGLRSAGILHLHQSLRATGARLGRTRDALAGRLLRHLDHMFVIAPSGVDAAAATWGISPDRCSNLLLGMPSLVPVERRTARQRLGLAPEAEIVAIIGRVAIRQKGHDLIVDALSRLAGSRARLRLAVAGDGPDAQSVGQLAARAGVADRIDWLGQIADIGLVLGAIDAIAMPSRFEGLPLVALEAIAAGVPGVAASVDGLADVWPEMWQVARDDPAALAHRLDTILSLDTAERETGLARARERAAAVTHRRTGAELPELLARIAHEPPRA